MMLDREGEQGGVGTLDGVGERGWIPAGKTGGWAFDRTRVRLQKGNRINPAPKHKISFPINPLTIFLHCFQFCQLCFELFDEFRQGMVGKADFLRFRFEGIKHLFRQFHSVAAGKRFISGAQALE